MTMVGQLICRHRFVALSELNMKRRCSSGTRYTRLSIDDDAVLNNQPCLHQWCQRQDRCCGVASGIGDERGMSDVMPVQLRQAVRRIKRLTVCKQMFGGIFEPEITAQIDHFALL